MKLYTRIVLFFTGVFFIVFLLAFILLFFFSQTLIQQVNRENLYDFNRSIVNIIEENKKDILVLPESERLPYVATLIEPIVKDNNQIEYKLSDNKSNTFRSSISIDAVINPENFDSSRSVYKYFITNSSQFFSSSSDTEEQNTTISDSRASSMTITKSIFNPLRVWKIFIHLWISSTWFRLSFA